MINFASILQVIGGLALFLYGVQMLASGMEKLAGNQIQKWLDRMTTKRIKAAAFGTAAAGILQSSSLLMVTMIGLINANLMTLEQAVGVMMGDEIGTTLTAQIVAFDVDAFCFLFMAIGFVCIEFLPHGQWREYGEVIFGFGILFLGMNLMSDGLGMLAELPIAEVWLAFMGQYTILGLLAGAVATAIVQSSSAVTGLVVAMGMSQIITLDGAVGLLLGANIGTCVTGFIASARLSRGARQASIAQIIINVVGVLLFLPFVKPFADLVSHTSSELPRQIANAHTIFNIATSVILFPFVPKIASAARWIAPEKEKQEVKLTAFIDERQYSMPPIALNEAMRELTRIGDLTATMLDNSRIALIDMDKDAIQKVLDQEREVVDPLCGTLERFVNRLMQENLSVRQQQRCFQLKNLLSDIERVGDLSENLAQVALEKFQDGVEFSPQAIGEIDHLFMHAHQTYTQALLALKSQDRTLADRVCSMEIEFDGLYWKARQGHIHRMNDGICAAEADVMYTETLRNLERISDHADNIGISVIRSK
ncbi:MAG: Na/Pi cotransporter family protein [Anaerolineales bacterium]|nr:Na/Pi cotransporter family protein [Anaerolineales bacterium]